MYPGFTRRIFLRGYRYSLHMRPKSLLIEAGAQTNTVEEMRNAMELLAVTLQKVIVENPIKNRSLEVERTAVRK